MSENTTTGSELEKIDLIALLNDFFHRLRQIWWVVVLLTALFAAASYYRVTTSYTPSYMAEATVSVEIMFGSSRGNQNTAEQMGSIFPYILTSGALSDVIASDLGTRSVPGTIKVTNIKGTNLLTITVTSGDPDNANKVLDSVLKNYPEVAQYVVGQTELKVIDRGDTPSDVSRMSVIRGSMIRGALAGLALGLFIVFISAISLRTIRSESELRSLLNVPCLGTLPLCKKKQRRKSESSEINILYDRNRGEYVEAMRLIRTRLERQMTDKKVLMVTSSIAGEGKSTVAANLAISMAGKGKRVILVDCDLRSPSVSRIFGLKKKFPGLVPLLRGRCSLDDAVMNVEYNGKSTTLTLLPGGEKETRLVEILSSDAMRALIDKLRDQYDVVILDTPPSAILVDAMILVNYVDAVAYVVMNDFARRRYIFNGVEELMAGDAPIVGCILNGGRARSGSYGYYGYKSRYGYGYGYGSGETKMPESKASSSKKPRGKKSEPKPAARKQTSAQAVSGRTPGAQGDLTADRDQTRQRDKD